MLSLSEKTALTLAVAATAAAPAASALAAGASTTLKSPSDVKIEGVYAFPMSYKPVNRPLIQVVVKTKGEMPRRYDGLIRAGGRIVDNGGGGSTGSIGGRQSRCYTFTVAVKKDGRFYPGNGRTRGDEASVGSTHRVEFSVKDADGVERSSTRSFTIRAKKAGDLSGKPLGC